MQANWGLIINVLLLVGVIVVIGRLMRARKESLSADYVDQSPSLGEKTDYSASLYQDDIIAVRKLTSDDEFQPSLGVTTATVQATPKTESITPLKSQTTAPSTIMMFLLAKENRQFAGYELLQTVLAAGLRFGEGQLFHRHQFANGQGPVLCSLASATASGVFDLQNIGAFSVRGLCLFMESCNNPGIDEERFSIMLETAKQLSEGLDAHLLDDQRKPLTEERINRYCHMLEIDPVEAIA